MPMAGTILLVFLRIAQRANLSCGIPPGLMESSAIRIHMGMNVITPLGDNLWDNPRDNRTMVS